MRNEETKNLKLLIIVIVFLAFFSLIYNLFVKNKETVDNEKVDNESIYVVMDHNRFYTVSSCVSKYINYLVIDDTENLLILLSDEYINSNNINSNNLYNYIDRISGNKSFSPIKMYQKKLADGLYEYYVYGSLLDENINGISKKEDFYLIVELDEKNMTFAIKPYDGNMFK